MVDSFYICDIIQNFFNVRHHFPSLDLNEMSEHIRGQVLKNRRSRVDRQALTCCGLTTSEYGHRIALCYIMDITSVDLPFTFLGNFDKGIARHILNTIVRFVHEFKQFIDDCF